MLIYVSDVGLDTQAFDPIIAENAWWARFCGLTPTISFMLRERRGPRFLTAGGDLTGVHFLRGQPRPRRGSYHIGGSGIFPDEALIRTLGESCERYAQLVAAVYLRDSIKMASYDELVAAERPSCHPTSWAYFGGATGSPGLPL